MTTLRDFSLGSGFLCALAGLAWPSGAHAQNEPHGGAGLYLRLAFEAKGSVGLGWGMEAFTTVSNGSCSSSSSPHSGVGPVVEFGMIGLEDPRIVIAAYGGTELRDDPWSIGAEVGVVHRWGRSRGSGLRLALVPSLAMINGHAGAEVLLNEYSVGAGVLTTSRLGPTTCPEVIVGRPLRSSSGETQLAHATWGNERAHAAESRHDLAAAAWLRDAQSEYASVPAFHELALQLAAVGSPQALIARALRAAEQEMRHTRLCAALARRHGQRDVLLELPNAAPRAPLGGLDGLMRLATESWLDGCLNEGSAAALAAEAARTSHDDDTRSALTRIPARLSRGLAARVGRTRPRSPEPCAELDGDPRASRALAARATAELGLNRATALAVVESAYGRSASTEVQLSRVPAGRRGLVGKARVPERDDPWHGRGNARARSPGGCRGHGAQPSTRG